MKNETIKFNVGGTLFETTFGTIKHSSFLNALCDIKWGENKEPIFIDRDSKHFKHVLAFLRDYRYPFPLKLYYELDFYGIKYNECADDVNEDTNDDDSSNFTLPFEN